MNTFDTDTIVRTIVRDVMTSRTTKSEKAATNALFDLLAGWDKRDRDRLPETATVVDKRPTDDHLKALYAAGELPNSAWWVWADPFTKTVHARAFIVGTGYYYEGDYLEGSRHRGSRVHYTGAAYADVVVRDGEVISTQDWELQLS